jgi:hypothetical protein
VLEVIRAAVAKTITSGFARFARSSTDWALPLVQT